MDDKSYLNSTLKDFHKRGTGMLLVLLVSLLGIFFSFSYSHSLNIGVILFAILGASSLFSCCFKDRCLRRAIKKEMKEESLEIDMYGNVWHRDRDKSKLLHSFQDEYTYQDMIDRSVRNRELVLKMKTNDPDYKKNIKKLMESK